MIFALEKPYKIGYNVAYPNKDKKVIIIITIQEQIKTALVHSGMSLTELAKQFGISQPGFTQRMKTGKFTKAELEKIASILGCEYISCFRFPDGKEY